MSMKQNLKSAFVVMCSFLSFACSPDGNNDPLLPDTGSKDSVAVSEIYYVLNSGDWKSNNSSLTRYDAASGETEQYFFETKNARGLGNTANDVLVYGSKMYIAVAGESTIEVTDLEAKSIKQIECEAQPRYLAASGGDVYVSYYDGYVARLDTATLSVEAKVKVGRNPEQLAVVGNRLYVANSGGMDWDTELGYDNTVSVIDIPSFCEIKKVDVVLNPSVVVALGEGVFVASYGNYADVPSTLQYIGADDVVSVVNECSNMTEICANSGVLYGFFSQYDENWNATITYMSYNPVAGTVDSPWIKEKELPAPYKVCSAGNFVCVTSSDYVNDGDVYIYDTDGMLVTKIAVGLNPVKVVKVN